MLRQSESRGRKRLTAFLPHSPAFDSTFPLLERLHLRGKVEVVAVVGPRLCKVEPRAIDACQNAGLPFLKAGILRLEVLSLVDILRSDAILTHSDPIAYSAGKIRPRDAYTVRSRTPVIFVQHGMVQAGLHYPAGTPQWRFYAEQMLVWKPLPQDARSFIRTPLENRVYVTGLLKCNRLGPAPLAAQLRASFAHYRQRVLICHNYGFERMLYSQEAQNRMFDIWFEAMQQRGDTLFILRSHRGRKHRAFESRMNALRRGCPNVVLSDRHSGLMRMATIHDVMSIVDRVVSHPSTVVLDAVYDEKSVAVFDSKEDELSDLHQVGDLDSFLEFLDGPHDTSRSRSLRDIYGEVDRNLDVAAEQVERYLDAL
jgi:hypothetical protein